MPRRPTCRPRGICLQIGVESPPGESERDVKYRQYGLRRSSLYKNNAKRWQRLPGLLLLRRGPTLSKLLFAVAINVTTDNPGFQTPDATHYGSIGCNLLVFISGRVVLITHARFTFVQEQPGFDLQLSLRTVVCIYPVVQTVSNRVYFLPRQTRVKYYSEAHISISQGNVATRLRCGGVFLIASLQ